MIGRDRTRHRGRVPVKYLQEPPNRPSAGARLAVGFKQKNNYDWQTRSERVGNNTAVPDRAAKLQRQFGNVIRAERKLRRLTQQQLAFESSLSLTYVGEIERGQRMVSLDTLVRLASALDLTAAELLHKAKL